MKLALPAILCFFGVQSVDAAGTENLANPSKHPFADPRGGRENYELANETVNEARLYDFYQRQADYYLANPSEVSSIVPAYPGLDAGQHGHWGKHNQNNYQDDRWNAIEPGEHRTTVFKPDGISILKGICIRLGEQRELSACFDPLSLSYRSVWQGGFLKYDPFRWGTSRDVTPVGDIWFTIPSASMPQASRYLGFRRFGKRIVFEYTIGDVAITDEPWATSDAFYRRIDLKPSSSQIRVPFPIGDDLEGIVVSKRNVTRAVIEDGSILLDGVNAGASVIVRASKVSEPREELSAVRHLRSARRPERRWPESLKMPGTLGTPRNDSAYALSLIHI